MRVLKMGFCLILLFFFMGEGFTASAAEGPIKKVMTVNQTYKAAFTSDRGNNHWWWSASQLPNPGGVYVITKINGSMKLTGTAYDPEIHLASGDNSQTEYMVHDVLNRELNYTKGEGVGFRYLFLGIRGESYTNYGVEVTINTIEYLSYPMNVDVKLTPEKYVELRITSPGGFYSIPKIKTRVEAISDGNRLLPGSNAGASTYTDTSVNIGRTYKYRVYAGATDDTYRGLSILGDYSILVPSPMDETKEIAEQARDAAREASQNASLANQNAYNAWQAALDTKKQVIQSESNINNKLDTMETNLKNDFNNRISLAENNITKKLGDVETNLKTDITNMGTNINNKLGDMESSLKTDITNLGSDINSKLANINTSIVNMQSSSPPTLIKVAGYNKATATKNSTFKVSMTYSGANEYRWKLDGGDWSSWTNLKAHDESGYFTASGVNGAGTHTVMVEIRQASTVNDPATGKPTPAYSPVAKGQFSFFKL
jgi:hypothetical protein